MHDRMGPYSNPSPLWTRGRRSWTGDLINEEGKWRPMCHITLLGMLCCVLQVRGDWIKGVLTVKHCLIVKKVFLRDIGKLQELYGLLGRGTKTTDVVNHGGNVIQCSWSVNVLSKQLYTAIGNLHSQTPSPMTLTILQCVSAMWSHCLRQLQFLKTALSTSPLAVNLSAISRINRQLNYIQPISCL